MNAGDTRLGYHDYVQHCLDADSSDNQLVLRAAPRWAWITIDELLGNISNDDMLDRDGDYLIYGDQGAPNQIQPLREAYSAILLACERADDEPISRRQIQTLMKQETP
ncbi:MAG: hypothetical protein RLQ73_02475 [Hoeflea sp. D1-CHI-28]